MLQYPRRRYGTTIDLSLSPGAGESVLIDARRWLNSSGGSGWSGLLLTLQANGTITICGDPSESWEAATDTKLCTTATAHDPIPDQDVTDRLEYAVHVVTQNTFGDEHTGPEQCRSYVNDTTCADTYLTTAITSEPNPTYYKVKYYVCDRAGMYGVCWGGLGLRVSEEKSQ